MLVGCEEKYFTIVYPNSKIFINFNLLTQNIDEMKNHLYFSQDFLRETIESLSAVIDNPQNFLISLDENEILREDQIAKMLNITTRSLRNYRKK